MEHVQAPEWSRIAESDLVCFSTLSAGADKTRTHASYYPESCLEFSDYVVFGEGDETILALVDALVRGRGGGTRHRLPARRSSPAHSRPSGAGTV